MLALWMCLQTDTIKGQYTNDTYLLGYYNPGDFAIWGSGTSFFDFNDDGLDDITVCTTNAGVNTFINTGDGFEYVNFLGYIPGTLMHATWVDLENDGDNDFFVSRLIDKPILLRNDGNFVFTDISDALPCPFDFPNSTCATWGDYDNDSYPDLYMSNYHPSMDTVTSWMFHNNGDGTFDEIAGQLNIDNGVHQAYQCIWMDYDLDVDLDLIIVNDNNDGCKMYENDGNGNFTDRAQENGFDIDGDLMGLSPSDFDHDGDYDFFITNNAGNIFMICEEDEYSNEAHELHVDVECTSWAATFIDTHNSGWEDLYVLSNAVCYGNTNYYYKNYDGETYHDDLEAFDSPDLPAYSAAKGDFNNDGRYDIVLSNGYQVVDIQLWRNTNAGGHYIKINLDGTISNRHGIGSTAHIYSSGQHVMKPFLCGESYLSQDSQNMIVGLGESTMVDSIIVQWPSGWKDRYYNLDVDLTYRFTEGETFTAVNSDNVVEFCEGSVLSISANDNAIAYLWNTGDSTQTINISMPGEYEVDVTNFTGISYTQYFSVNLATNPFVNTVASHPSCHADTDGAIYVETNAQAINAFQWSDNANSLNRENLAPGNYQLNIEWINSCNTSFDFTLSDPPPITVSYTPDTICSGATTSIDCEVMGGNGTCVINWYGVNPATLHSGYHPIQIIDANYCVLDSGVMVMEYPPINFTYAYDMPCFGEATELVYSAECAGQACNVDFGPIDPENVFAGTYDFIIADGHDCISEFGLIIEENTELHVDTVIGMLTDDHIGSITLTPSGGTSPYNYLWNTNETDSIVLFSEAGVYSCLVTDAMGCSVQQEFEMINLGLTEFLVDCHVFPNPFQDQLTIQSSSPTAFVIYDAQGKVVEKNNQQKSNHVLDLHAFAEGIYILKTNAGFFQLIK